jgi:hypothetical protein
MASAQLKNFCHLSIVDIFKLGREDDFDELRKYVQLYEIQTQRIVHCSLLEVSHHFYQLAYESEQGTQVSFLSRLWQSSKIELTDLL